jgi:Methyltransferase domain
MTLATTTDPARSQFLALIDPGAAPWQRLVLGKPVSVGATNPAQRVVVRPVQLRGQTQLQFVETQSTRDLTHNLPWQEALQQIDAWLGPRFRNAHLFVGGQETQLLLSRKGKGHISTHGQAADGHEPIQDLDRVNHDRLNHDRQKQRWLTPDRPFLAALGVTNAHSQVVPAMARKWKQINKFVEVFAGALARSRLANTRELSVVDFGAGKAYLSFAVHDWLTQSHGITAQVTAVELRADLVAQGQQTVAALGLQGMHVVEGDVRHYAARGDVRDTLSNASVKKMDVMKMDVMVALHACDTATDYAIHLGLQAGADIILCSPCCHKQLRPQLLSPHPLKSVFAHGIHVEQHAEMVTDSLRALMLQAQGYDTQVFEFVALEHTSKNKMILAIKRAHPQPALVAAALQQAQELQQFYGVQEHCLQTLLRGNPTSAVLAPASAGASG